MRLLDLPNEVLHKILTEASGWEVVRCKQTCRRLGSLVDGSTALQYMIELFAEAKRDVPNHPASILSRLKQITQHRRARISLEWTVIKKYSFGMDFDQALVTLDMLVVSKDRDLIIHTLSPIHSGIRPDTWSLKLMVPFSDFAVDPFHDVLVVLTTISESLEQVSDLAVYTLSEGKPHPLAYSMGVIPLRFPANYQLIMHGHGDVVAVANPGAPIELCLTNWKTGEQTQMANFDRHQELLSFFFLNDNYLLLLVMASQARDTFSLQVLRIRDLTLICVLWLPNPIDLDSDPELVSGYISPHSFSSAGVPFLTDDSDCLVSVTCRPAHSPTLWHMIVRRSSILECVEEAENLPHPRILDWPDWIAHGTVIKSPGACSVHGLTAVILHQNTIHFYNFNSRSVRRHIGQDEPSSSNIQVVYDVASSFPYRRVVKYLPPDVQINPLDYHVMLTERAIIIDSNNDPRNDYFVVSLD